MKVEFVFNENAVIHNGYTMKDVYYTIKSEFEGRNLPCISDGDILAFRDNGKKNDFSHMWAIIMSLTRADWFMNCAKSCLWYESDDRWEDVLRQAKESRKKDFIK